MARFGKEEEEVLEDEEMVKVRKDEEMVKR